jgi:hypothetical protein
MPNLTLLDVAKLNGNDVTVGLIEENLSYAPELSIFPVIQKKGTSYYTVKRTGVPTVGFRDANGGIATSKSTFKKELHECYIFGGAVNVDKAVASAYDGGMAELEMIEAGGVAKSSFLALGSQIWYGVSKDAKGFPGIKSLVAKGDALGYDATGSTATTASSIYGVKFGPQDAALIFGNGTTLDLPAFMDQQLFDASGNAYPGRVSNLSAWVGLQIGNANCVGRIANVTADSGKGCTDALLSAWLEKFPVGNRPDAIFMSRRSAGQLQRSRSVTIMNGAAGKVSGAVENVAPWPTSAFDIPIVVTDSIGNTDAIE